MMFKFQCASCKLKTDQDTLGLECPNCGSLKWKRIPKKKLSKKGKKRIPKPRIPIPPIGSRHKSKKDYNRKREKAVPKLDRALQHTESLPDNFFGTKTVPQDVIDALTQILKERRGPFSIPPDWKVVGWGPGLEDLEDRKEPTCPTFDSYICHDCQLQVGFCRCTIYVREGDI